jgi:CrcB protein
MFGVRFPWGTLFINISGSLFLGWFMTVLRERLPDNGLGWSGRDQLQLLVAVGFTGAYTTFSTFEFEAYQLVADSEHWKAVCYLFGSVFLGLAAVWVGVWLGRNT